MNATGLQGVSADAIVAIAREAGRRILDVKNSSQLDTRAKQDTSPVTAADIAASAYICEALSQLATVAPVISEEDLPAGAVTADIYWLVDPLDGTKEFVQGSGEYTVNIALIRGRHPVFGVVLIPESDVAYVGGTSCNPCEIDKSGRSTEIRCRKFQPESPSCLLSRSHRSNEEDLLKEIFPTVKVRHAGSSLKYTGIAKGDFDFSFRKTPTSLWDTAAAHAVLNAAGGDIVGADGKPLVYDPARLLNPPFIAVGDPAADWSALLGVLT